MQGTQYATKRSILCRGAFCGPTVLLLIIAKSRYCNLELLTKITSESLNGLDMQTFVARKNQPYNYGFRICSKSTANVRKRKSLCACHS